MEQTLNELRDEPQLDQSDIQTTDQSSSESVQSSNDTQNRHPHLRLLLSARSNKRTTITRTTKQPTAQTDIPYVNDQHDEQSNPTNHFSNRSNVGQSIKQSHPPFISSTLRSLYQTSASPPIIKSFQQQNNRQLNKQFINQSNNQSNSHRTEPSSPIISDQHSPILANDSDDCDHSVDISINSNDIDNVDNQSNDQSINQSGDGLNDPSSDELIDDESAYTDYSGDEHVEQNELIHASSVEQYVPHAPQSTNQSTNQSPHQLSVQQSNHHAIDQQQILIDEQHQTQPDLHHPIEPLIRHVAALPNERSPNQFQQLCQSDQPVNQSVNQPINQSNNQTINQSNKHIQYHPVDQQYVQPPAIQRSIHQSSKQSTEMSMLAVFDQLLVESVNLVAQHGHQQNHDQSIDRTISQSNNQLSALADELANAKREIANLQSINQSINQSFDDYKLEMRDAIRGEQGRRDVALREMRAMELQIQNMSLEHSNNQRDHQVAMQQLAIERKALHNDMSIKQSKFEELLKEQSDLNEQMNQTIKQQIEQIKRLETVHAEKEEEWQIERREFEGSKASLIGALESLHEQRDEQSTSQTELIKSLRSQLADLQCQLDAHQTREHEHIQQMTQRAHEQQREQADAKNLVIAELRQSLQATVVQSQKDLRDMEDKVSMLTMELSIAQSRITQMTNSVYEHNPYAHLVETLNTTETTMQPIDQSTDQSTNQSINQSEDCTSHDVDELPDDLRHALEQEWQMQLDDFKVNFAARHDKLIAELTSERDAWKTMAEAKQQRQRAEVLLTPGTQPGAYLFHNELQTPRPRTSKLDQTIETSHQSTPEGVESKAIHVQRQNELNQLQKEMKECVQEKLQAEKQAEFLNKRVEQLESQLAQLNQAELTRLRNRTECSVQTSNEATSSETGTNTETITVEFGINTDEVQTCEISTNTDADASIKQVDDLIDTSPDSFASGHPSPSNALNHIHEELADVQRSLTEARAELLDMQTARSQLEQQWRDQQRQLTKENESLLSQIDQNKLLLSKHRASSSSLTPVSCSRSDATTSVTVGDITDLRADLAAWKRHVRNTQIQLDLAKEEIQEYQTLNQALNQKINQLSHQSPRPCSCCAARHTIVSSHSPAQCPEHSSILTALRADNSRLADHVAFLQFELAAEVAEHETVAARRDAERLTFQARIAAMQKQAMQHSPPVSTAANSFRSPIIAPPSVRSRIASPTIQRHVLSSPSSSSLASSLATSLSSSVTSAAMSSRSLTQSFDWDSNDDDERDDDSDRPPSVSSLSKFPSRSFVKFKRTLLSRNDSSGALSASSDR